MKPVPDPIEWPYDLQRAVNKINELVQIVEDLHRELSIACARIQTLEKK